ncbi:MAG: LysE family transporter [Candidatus Zixiibacteriota bacterium]
MELLALFINSFVVGLSGALMPGPLLAVGIAETPRSGWQTGPIISVGHAIAEIGVVVALSMGVVVVAQRPIVTSAIGIVGGVALVLMAISMGRDVLTNRVRYGSVTVGSESKHRLAGKGITATLSNPYWFIWWATVGLAFLVESQSSGWIGPVVFYFGHILSDFVWYTLVSVLIWRGKRLLAGGGLKALILICAGFLVLLGVRFVYRGLTGAI